MKASCELKTLNATLHSKMLRDRVIDSLKHDMPVTILKCIAWAGIITYSIYDVAKEAGYDFGFGLACGFFGVIIYLLLDMVQSGLKLGSTYHKVCQNKPLHRIFVDSLKYDTYEEAEQYFEEEREKEGIDGDVLL